MYMHTRAWMRALATLVEPGRAIPRRTAMVAPFEFGLATPYRAVVAGLQKMDDLLYEPYKDVEIDKPIFIIANPRSGTTFFHRLMCMDEGRFTYTKLWHTIIPSVAGYRAVKNAYALDSKVGGPLGRLFQLIERASFGGWDGIHNMGFDAAEEDEAYYFMAHNTPAMMFQLPYPELFEWMDLLDEQPREHREGLMNWYKGNLQRHMYEEGEGKTLLVKSVLSSGRVRSINDTFPDCRIVHMVRHPYDALPSFCSMFAMPWFVMVPGLEKDTDRVRYWARLGIKFYKHMLAAQRDLDEDRFITVRYDDLIENPTAEVRRVYERFGLPMTTKLEIRLDESAARRTRNYINKNQYSLEEYGLTRDYIYSELEEVFEAYGFER